jgi:hypothetical protein
MQTGKQTVCQHIDLSWCARLFLSDPFCQNINLTFTRLFCSLKSGVVHFWRRAQPKVICNQIGSATAAAAAAGKIKPLRARFQFQLALAFAFALFPPTSLCLRQFGAAADGVGWKGDLAAASRADYTTFLDI